jgi:hypothetical protein
MHAAAIAATIVSPVLQCPCSVPDAQWRPLTEGPRYEDWCTKWDALSEQLMTFLSRMGIIQGHNLEPQIRVN